jgi:hypothetical protein
VRYPDKWAHCAAPRLAFLKRNAPPVDETNHEGYAMRIRDTASVQLPHRHHGAVVALLAAALTMTTGGLAAAEGTTIRNICHNSGPHPTEAFGDRSGHAVQVIDSSCTMQGEGGPLDGTVLTQQSVWEYDKGASTLLSSHGVYRKPGTMAAYVSSAGTLSLEATEGKVTGWTASGKGRIAGASGSAAALSGKTYSWTARPIGNRAYVMEFTFE